MATPKGGTPIDKPMIDRVSGALGAAGKGVRQLIAGVTEAWFGPLQPMQPVAQAEAHGRALDYPVGWNLSSKPRGESGAGSVDFATLRRLADPGQGGLDLMRVAIETRKDEMAAQKYGIRPRVDKREQARKRQAVHQKQKADLEAKQADNAKAQAEAQAAAIGKADLGADAVELPPESPQDKRAREVEEALRSPDLVHTFQQWQRMLLEDLLVIDAPTLYVGRNRPGGVGKLPEVMDGATVKVLIDGNGRRPLPPSPAYQQQLKGMPATDYTLDELIQMPRNLRSDHVYGYSPVEQVITTVNIALRRQLMQLMHYTEGNIPEAFIPTPAEWSLDQVKMFQEYWDSILEGREAARRHAKFVPAGVAPIFTHDPKLKDDFDDWLARIVCWAFSLSPQALVKEMNRATAQTSKQTSQEQGLEPLKLWWKDLMDLVLAKAFGAPDLEFVYEDEEIADPLVKAQVFQIATGGKAWARPSEARDAYGWEPDAELDLPPAPPPGLPPPGSPPKPGGPPEKGDDGAAEKVMQLIEHALEKSGRRVFVPKTMKRA
jgi:hypothetical protein